MSFDMLANSVAIHDVWVCTCLVSYEGAAKGGDSLCLGFITIS